MTVRILTGDCRDVLAGLPAGEFHTCCTSPPYFGLRDYGHEGQIGLEPTPDEFVAALVAVFREVRRVLRDDGTVWLNLGDSYAGNGTNRNGLGNSVIGSGPNGACKQREIAGSARSVVPPGIKPKDLIGIPWMVAFALRADGWVLRQEIIWAKKNPMPESVRDRCTKSHEQIFLLAKSNRTTIWQADDTGEWSNYPDLTQRLPAPEEDEPDATRPRWRGFNYYFDAKAIAEDAEHPLMRHRSTSVTPEQEAAFRGNAPSNLGRCGTNDDGTRNRRSVWTVASQPFSGAHFATFPPDLIEPCILAGCPVGGHVLDPFAGAGTTLLVSSRLGRSATGIELNPAYADLARRRLYDDCPMFSGLEAAE